MENGDREIASFSDELRRQFRTAESVRAVMGNLFHNIIR